MKLLLLFAASVCAFAQLERPLVGVMLDQNGDARPVLGAAASATLGDAILQGVLSMECSSRGCLAKTAAALVSTSGETADAPEGPAIFGGSYVYFSTSRQLARWHEGILEPLALVADGDLLALRPNGDGVDCAVERDGATWIEHWSPTDNSLRVIAAFGAATAAMFADETTLLATADAVRLLRPDGTDAVLPVAGVQAFIRMSDGYVEFVTSQGMWVLDLARSSLSLLPGVAE
jgi:hypothetical protein